ncbi:MAG: hypothetical protein L6Q98_19740 [Anaerolineae bacterium]|nr:hypothetical protein [Anaerolineae bacterium]NUQ04683.1 SH3 domain-containing protein [Anaerolineae bacterium]
MSWRSFCRATALLCLTVLISTSSVLAQTTTSALPRAFTAYSSNGSAYTVRAPQEWSGLTFIGEPTLRICAAPNCSSTDPIQVAIVTGIDQIAQSYPGSYTGIDVSTVVGRQRFVTTMLSGLPAGASADPIQTEDINGQQIVYSVVRGLQPGVLIAITVVDPGDGTPVVLQGIITQSTSAEYLPIFRQIASSVTVEGSDIGAPMPTSTRAPLVLNIINYGETDDGTLTTTDPTFYQFNGSAGDAITIILNSTDFDPILELQDGSDTQIASNDDFNGLNSQIDLILPETETYRIVVRSFSSGDSGLFQLSLILNSTGNAVPNPSDEFPSAGLDALSERMNPRNQTYAITSTVRLTEDMEIPLLSVGGWISGNEDLVILGASSDSYCVVLDRPLMLDLQSYDLSLFAFALVVSLGGSPQNVPVTESHFIVQREITPEILSYLPNPWRVIPASATVGLERNWNDLCGYEAGDPNAFVVPTLTPTPVLIYGDVIEGQLRGTAQQYTFLGTAGDTVTIGMTSPDFDTYLELNDANGNRIASNDDFNGLNSQLTTTLPETGNYQIAARGYSSSASGAFVLTLDGTSVPDGQSPPIAAETTILTIAYGEVVTGTLEPGERLTYEFEGEIDDEVIITLTSEDFPPYLELGRHNTSIYANNANFDGGTTTRLQRELADFGGIIVVSAWGSQGSGDFELRLENTGLAIVPTEQPIAYGDVVSGRLPRGVYSLRYLFDGQAGDTVTITATSADYGAILSLVGPGGDRLEVDRRYSDVKQITQVLPGSGTYEITVDGSVVTGNVEFETSLILNSRSAPEPTAQAAQLPGTSATDPVILTYGDAVTGNMVNGQAASYVFIGAARDQVTINLASTDFDTALHVTDELGFDLDYNDDSNGTDNSQIVFTVPWDGYYFIVVDSAILSATGTFTLSLEGGNTDTLASGQQIAFERGGDIWLMNADGISQRPITSGLVASNPSWSPDGQQIVYLAPGSEGYDEIFVMDVDGTNIRQLTRGNFDVQNPTWLPDGRQIGYSRYNGGSSSTYVLNVDTQRSRVFIAGGTCPRWSPDGSSIAYIDYYGGLLYVANASGTNAREIARTPSISNTVCPVWSPYGSRLYTVNDGGNAIVEVDVATGNVRTITRHDAHDLTISPDGSMLAISDSTGIYLVDITNGSVEGPIAPNNSEAPAWQPDAAVASASIPDSSQPLATNTPSPTATPLATLPPPPTPISPLTSGSPSTDPIILSYGDTVTGNMVNGIAPLYTFVGFLGDEVAIRLESSEFDPVLELTDLFGSVVGSNDNFNGLNAQISLALPSSGGIYYIRPLSYSTNGTGSYTLSLILGEGAMGDNLGSVFAASPTAVSNPDLIITAPGNYQSEIGCPASQGVDGDWAPDCTLSQLFDTDGDGVYSFTTSAIPAGQYEVKVALDLSWALNYGADGIQDGANIPFTVPNDGDEVEFLFDTNTHLLTVTVTVVDASPAAVSPTPALLPEGQFSLDPGIPSLIDPAVECDTRDLVALFNDAQAAFNASDWRAAVNLYGCIVADGREPQGFSEFQAAARYNLFSSLQNCSYEYARIERIEEAIQCGARAYFNSDANDPSREDYYFWLANALRRGNELAIDVDWETFARNSHLLLRMVESSGESAEVVRYYQEQLCLAYDELGFSAETPDFCATITAAASPTLTATVSLIPIITPASLETILPTMTPTSTNTSLPTQTPPPSATPVSCPGTQPTRLAVGQTGRVIVEGGNTANRIRSQATASAGQVGSIPPGDEFAVIDGPICADGYAWWMVDYDGLIGWTAEGDAVRYWLEPLGGAPVIVPTAPPVGVLYVGGQATVFTADEGLKLRDATNTNSNILENMPSGIVVTLLEGPVSANGYVWWRVLSPSGREGWSVESADGIETLIPVDVTGAATGGTAVCSAITTPGDTNLRRGPGTSFEIAGVVGGGLEYTVIGQAINQSGFTWYQFENNLWARQDVVELQGDCTSIPMVR